MGIIGSTKKRILKSVKERSAHGYKLADRLDISLSSIYNHLGELFENGLIESRVEGRRKVYSLTDDGKKLLEVIE